jgi:hypothetical protein
MKGSIFVCALWVSIFLPVLQVSGFWYLWRDDISSPWWFGSIGIVAMYIIMAVCVTSAFSDIGITGASSNEPKVMFDPITVRYIGLILAGAITGAALLWVLRKIFGK